MIKVAIGCLFIVVILLLQRVPSHRLPKLMQEDLVKKVKEQVARLQEQQRPKSRVYLLCQEHRPSQLEMDVNAIKWLAVFNIVTHKKEH